ncbi:MAG: threonine synthase [Cytophagales bacterium]|nr:threonine synthase [Cytophagales bacterium]
MQFYSTNRQSPSVDFKTGVIKSLPADNGLYFPSEIPNIQETLTRKDIGLHEIAFETLKSFCTPDIPENRLLEIVEDVFSFELPVVPVRENVFSLELFHGPTYAFKDVGARFLARCLGYFNEGSNKEVTILVATSGDTGGAVAAGFYKVPGVKVIILYPSGKVSELQEKQLTTLGENIHALEIDGTFDDCQKLVKEAFLDEQLNQSLNLSSANSINIARWIPQSIYYLWACAQLADRENLVFSIPSGNYGNLAAGMLAYKMGAPISRFIASSNANDVVPRYLVNGKYEPLPTVATYSNAMDVGKPSNFPRMLELCHSDYSAMTKLISGFTLNDSQTLAAMKACLEQNEYLADPHGAIGYQALEEKIQPDETGIFLETAHPCKFLNVVEKVQPAYELPEFTKELMKKQKVADQMDTSFERFKDFLLKN